MSTWTNGVQQKRLLRSANRPLLQVIASGDFPVAPFLIANPTSASWAAWNQAAIGWSP